MTMQNFMAGVLAFAKKGILEQQGHFALQRQINGGFEIGDEIFGAQNQKAQKIGYREYKLRLPIVRQQVASTAIKTSLDTTIKYIDTEWMQQFGYLYHLTATTEGKLKREPLKFSELDKKIPYDLFADTYTLLLEEFRNQQKLKTDKSTNQQREESAVLLAKKYLQDEIYNVLMMCYKSLHQDQLDINIDEQVKTMIGQMTVDVTKSTLDHYEQTYALDSLGAALTKQFGNQAIINVLNTALTPQAYTTEEATLELQNKILQELYCAWCEQYNPGNNAPLKDLGKFLEAANKVDADSALKNDMRQDKAMMLLSAKISMQYEKLLSATQTYAKDNIKINLACGNFNPYPECRRSLILYGETLKIPTKTSSDINSQAEKTNAELIEENNTWQDLQISNITALTNLLNTIPKQHQSKELQSLIAKLKNDTDALKNFQAPSITEGQDLDSFHITIGDAITSHQKAYISETLQCIQKTQIEMLVCTGAQLIELYKLGPRSDKGIRPYLLSPGVVKITHDTQKEIEQLYEQLKLKYIAANQLCEEIALAYEAMYKGEHFDLGILSTEDEQLDSVKLKKKYQMLSLWNTDPKESQRLMADIASLQNGIERVKTMYQNPVLMSQFDPCLKQCESTIANSLKTYKTGYLTIAGVTTSHELNPVTLMITKYKELQNDLLGAPTEKAFQEAWLKMENLKLDQEYDWASFFKTLETDTNQGFAATDLAKIKKLSSADTILNLWLNKKLGQINTKETQPIRDLASNCKALLEEALKDMLSKFENGSLQSAKSQIDSIILLHGSLNARISAICMKQDAGEQYPTYTTISPEQAYESMCKVMFNLRSLLTKTEQLMQARNEGISGDKESISDLGKIFKQINQICQANKLPLPKQITSLYFQVYCESQLPSLTLIADRGAISVESNDVNTYEQMLNEKFDYTKIDFVNPNARTMIIDLFTALQITYPELQKIPVNTEDPLKFTEECLAAIKSIRQLNPNSLATIFLNNLENNIAHQKCAWKMYIVDYALQNKDEDPKDTTLAILARDLMASVKVDLGLTTYAELEDGKSEIDPLLNLSIMQCQQLIRMPLQQSGSLKNCDIKGEFNKIFDRYKQLLLEKINLTPTDDVKLGSELKEYLCGYLRLNLAGEGQLAEYPTGDPVPDRQAESDEAWQKHALNSLKAIYELYLPGRKPPIIPDPQKPPYITMLKYLEAIRTTKVIDQDYVSTILNNTEKGILNFEQDSSLQLIKTIKEKSSDLSIYKIVQPMLNNIANGKVVTEGLASLDFTASEWLKLIKETDQATDITIEFKTASKDGLLTAIKNAKSIDSNDRTIPDILEILYEPKPKLGTPEHITAIIGLLARSSDYIENHIPNTSVAKLWRYIKTCQPDTNVSAIMEKLNIRIKNILQGNITKLVGNISINLLVIPDDIIIELLNNSEEHGPIFEEKFVNILKKVTTNAIITDLKDKFITLDGPAILAALKEMPVQTIKDVFNQLEHYKKNSDTDPDSSIINAHEILKTYMESYDWRQKVLKSQFMQIAGQAGVYSLTSQTSYDSAKFKIYAVNSKPLMQQQFIADLTSESRIWQGTTQEALILMTECEVLDATEDGIKFQKEYIEAALNQQKTYLNSLPPSMPENTPRATELDRLLNETNPVDQDATPPLLSPLEQQLVVHARAPRVTNKEGAPIISDTAQEQLNNDMVTLAIMQENQLRAKLKELCTLPGLSTDDNNLLALLIYSLRKDEDKKPAYYTNESLMAIEQAILSAPNQEVCKVAQHCRELLIGKLYKIETNKDLVSGSPCGIMKAAINEYMIADNQLNQVTPGELRPYIAEKSNLIISAQKLFIVQSSPRSLPPEKRAAADAFAKCAQTQATEINKIDQGASFKFFKRMVATLTSESTLLAHATVGGSWLAQAAQRRLAMLDLKKLNKEVVDTVATTNTIR